MSIGYRAADNRSVPGERLAHRRAPPAGQDPSHRLDPAQCARVSAYASQLRANQRAFLGYYHWQVFYGDTLLPEGYPARPRQPLADSPSAP